MRPTHGSTSLPISKGLLKLARQIEKLCGKQSGWLDEIRDTPSTCLTDPADGIPQSSIRARRSASGPINRYNIQSARP